MLIEQVIVAVVSFFAVSVIMLAAGMLLKDMLGRKPSDDELRRLQLAPREPDGNKMDRNFFRFVEETGLPMDTTGALAIVVGCGLIGMTIPLVVFENEIYGAVGLLLGLLTPLATLQIVRWIRCQRMQKHLPETLQIVSDAVSSGYTLEESCALVVHEVKGPLQKEFEHAKHQFELGHSPLSIMARMVRRVPLPEFRVFATAVVVHQRAGGNLSLLTERMAHVARDRQEVRGHLMAVTAGSRLSAFGMVFGSIAAMVLLAILEPDYVGAFATHPMGPTLLLTAVGLMSFGIVWVWRLLRENY